jgi:hypothetical protein
VQGRKNYDELYDMLNFNMPGAFQIKLMNSNNMKINVSSERYYKMLTKLLNDNGVAWPSYENKQSRPIRVIVKTLRSTCKAAKIVEEQGNRGCKALDATNMLKWRSTEPLDIFMLTLNMMKTLTRYMK